MGNVTSLTRAGPVPCADRADLARWLAEWAEAFQNGAVGDIRTIVVMVENADGRLACVSQGIVPLDRTRLVGMLTTMAHRKMDGDGRVEDLG